MNKRFQKLLLSYFLQTRLGSYIVYLDAELFTLQEYQQLFQIVKDYYLKYNRVPAKDILDTLSPFELDPYYDAEIDEAYIEDNCLEIIKSSQLKSVLYSYADRFDQLSQKDLNKLLSEFEKIITLSPNSSGDSISILDTLDLEISMPVGEPCFLEGLNNLTEAKGFYSPQLIVFLGGPKSFKTGLLLKTALEYAKTGYKVFYADFENGEKMLISRIQQALLECTRTELREPTNRKILENMFTGLRRFGGDIRFKTFRAKHDTLNQVDEELDRLYSQSDWKPDIIFYDYLDIAASAAKKELREAIQFNYHHAVALNKKYDCFAFTVSKIKQSAVSKPVIGITDFAEDFEKAYNCHAAFGICRTDNDMERGTARIIPIAQRDGQPYKSHLGVWIELDEERMIINEMDHPPDYL